MIRTALLLALTSALHAAPPEAFWRALHQVETSGRTGAIVGDGGRSLGPLQISRACFADSRVAGRYEQVAELAFARCVAESYLKRYAPKAWQAGDVDTLARTWNGGPAGARKSATLPYAAKVRAAMGGVR